MIRLEDITPGAIVRGLLPGNDVTVESIKWIGSNVIELVYKTESGRVGNELVYRDRETQLEVVTLGKPFSLDTDGGLVRLAYLFDPHLAVHTSMSDPLPHQITAVYGEMLPRRPYAFCWLMTPVRER